MNGWGLHVRGASGLFHAHPVVSVKGER
jgi:hypothetical protein